MAEVSCAGEDHRDACLVGRSDHLLIPDGASRLDSRGDSSRDRGLQAIRKWEECIACEDRSASALASHANSEPHTFQAIWLAAAETDDRSMLRENNGIRLGVAHCLPSKMEIRPFAGSWFPIRHHPPAG